MSDTMRITILEDGTIRTETDKISAAAHQSAEGFLKGITSLTGGEASRKAKHGHQHTHHGQHAHAGHGHDHNHE